MNFKMLFIKILFSVLILTSNVFAKALPPGSGIGDIPANVLILLDKSGSMGARMTSGAGVYYPESVAFDSNGDVYAGQYYTYGIKKITYSTLQPDTSFGTNGLFRGTGTSGSCPIYYPRAMKVHNGYLYVTQLYGRKIVRINLSTNVCTSIANISHSSTLDIQNDILYSFNRWGIVVRNLSTNTNISCSWSGELRTNGDYAYGMAVDHTGSNLYLQEYNYLLRFEIQANKCPKTSRASRWRQAFGTYSFGMKAHPTDDKILYGTNYYSHRLHKVTFNAAKTSIVSNTHVGRCCSGASKTGNVRMRYPRNIDIDATNNRIAVADYYKNSLQFFDLNLGFLKELGGSSGTRMGGAHAALKAIVTDSSLTSGVNFGFGYWAWGGNPGFRSWSGDITTGTANPCNSTACIKVRAHKGGAARINQVVTSVSPGGGTNAADWAKQAKEYYLHGSLSPIDKTLTCQNSYVLIIGDGYWSNHNSAKNTVKMLLKSHGIKTFTVAYGSGLSGSGINNFRDMAKAGGTNDVIIASTAASLKTQLKAAISQVIASKLSFTAPAITATIEKGGSLYQAQFDYVQNQEWQGTLKRTAINSSGVIDITDKGNWSASDVMKKNISKRKIWTVLAGSNAPDYKTDYNNFTDSNWKEIKDTFELFNNEVPEYHSKTTGGTARPQNTTRCANTSGVADGSDDDVKGLINFIRGQDYFDYDADCNLTEIKENPLGDIYHSELVVVGAPSAETSFVSTNQESYWRSINGYDAWAEANKTRTEMIYVGANDGLLHAFDGKTGQEKWAFAPPLVVPHFPLMVNQNLNRAGKGGTNAIYGVDGSPVVHDMYFKSPLGKSKAWHTILFVPYGRGGNGFSVIDITKPLKPLHLFSIYNDTTFNQVHRVDHEGNFNAYPYIPTSYALSSLPEAIAARQNVEMSNGSQSCTNTLDNGLPKDQCFKSKTWTFPEPGLSKADLEIIKDGKKYTSFNVSSNSNGDTVINFADNITYYGWDACAGATGPCNTVSTDIGFSITAKSKKTGVQNPKEYEYSKLGETWSAPRIFRLPLDGRRDTDISNDRYVAVMGGGYGTQYAGVGNALFVIDLEDPTNPGSIEKVIDIEDILASDIVNSTPGTPVVITPDTARGLDFTGALVYLNDFEGKISKFNLTNMKYDSPDLKTRKKVELYDNTTLFWAGSTKTNGRYMFHSMDASIGEGKDKGQKTNTLWLYAGTGDYERIAGKETGTENVLLGIKDENYPLFKDVDGTQKPIDPKKLTNISKCKNVTKDTTGASCPQKADAGWYTTLSDYKKVTAEPTVSRGVVYFPIYKPSASTNACSLGDALICGLDDECGTNLSGQLGQNPSGKNYMCKYVGQGVLSKIVTFAGKIFSNIAGQADCDAIKDVKKKKECKAKTDLVQIDAAVGGVSTYRSSWRHNY
ncbi:PilC/PilY family type IV pilus protein [Candidatus Pelagibacter sp.]|nr:PilC/PilY family type IV pilus protein [Candidatus Pelagibacter sp.]